MALLVRKIDRAKWRDENIDIINNDFPADAITKCMTTSGNTLSAWRISSIEEINEAVLAIVSGQKHLAALDIVCLDDSVLLRLGIELRDTPGITPVTDLKNRHVDISNLSYKSLGVVAAQIGAQILKSQFTRFAQGDLVSILKSAISSNRLQLNDLPEDITKKL